MRFPKIHLKSKVEFTDKCLMKFGKRSSSIIKKVLRSFVKWIFLPDSTNQKNTKPYPTLDGVRPLCPKCKTVMVKKIARRGHNAGDDFWGCPRYPGCRGARDV